MRLFRPPNLFISVRFRVAFASNARLRHLTGVRLLKALDLRIRIVHSPFELHAEGIILFVQ